MGQIRVFTACLMAFFILIACSSSPDKKEPETAKAIELDERFNAYWYKGKAELTRFELQQSRYGELRSGDAVLIFVTEDFWANKQVKYEFGDKTEAVLPILKLNFTRTFNTGIYPYSMMTSIFSPVQKEQSLKVSMTSQEWCGHAFGQLNLREGEYIGQLRSYFQAEGDREYRVQPDLLEDEVWTRIRLNPWSLPTGTIDVVPGMQFERLAHTDPGAYKAVAERDQIRNETFSKNLIEVYRLTYEDLPRVLEVYYEPVFPHRILGWEERFRPVRLGSDEWKVTRAVRTHEIMSDYWSRNSVADSLLRGELGLK